MRPTVYQLIFKSIPNEYFTEGADYQVDTLMITQEQFLKFKSLLEDSYFWDLSFETRSEILLDGEYWTLEGICKFPSNDTLIKYNIVERQNPRKGSFRSACEYLQILAYPVSH